MTTPREDAIAAMLAYDREHPASGGLRTRIDALRAALGAGAETPDLPATLAEAVSDSLAATTMGTDWAEAPEPSDEPGSPYVMRLTNELRSRGVIDLASPETAEALARALVTTVGRHGWLRSTPPDPVAEWRMNAAAILAAMRETGR